MDTLGPDFSGSRDRMIISLILGTRFSILRARTGSLKHLKKTCSCIILTFSGKVLAIKLLATMRLCRCWIATVCCFHNRVPAERWLYRDSVCCLPSCVFPHTCDTLQRDITAKSQKKVSIEPRCVIKYWSACSCALSLCHRNTPNWRTMCRCQNFQGSYDDIRPFAPPAGCANVTIPASRSFYIQARTLEPRNGRPYNQLAVLAVRTRRRLDAIYYYARSLATTGSPILSARESLISLFDDARRKVVNALVADAVGLAQGFPTWGPCAPRGTFAYPKGYI